jgi:hypothetical protein
MSWSLRAIMAKVGIIKKIFTAYVSRETMAKNVKL